MWKVTYYNNDRNGSKGHYDFRFRGTFTKCHLFISFIKERDGHTGLSSKLFVELA